MIDILRFFRLGIINIMGITVPGLLLISLSVIGFFLPAGLVIVPYSAMLFGPPDYEIGELVLTWFNSQGWFASALILFFLLVFAYIVGYIIRLSSPDVLDLISAEKIVNKMGIDALKEDHWPYRGDPKDRFPYFHFKDYLTARGLPELANLVQWGNPESEEPGKGKRTKTQINMMKLEVANNSPELSATLEGNEAHVRLMFGTWSVIKICIPLIFVGIALNVLGLGFRLLGPKNLTYPNPPYAVAIFYGLVLLVGMYWASNRIISLFHYQRVKELMFIVGCTYFSRKNAQENKKTP